MSRFHRFISMGLFALSLQFTQCDEQPAPEPTPTPTPIPIPTGITLTQARPSFGDPDGGTPVSLVGSHFDAGSKVFFAGIEARVIGVPSDKVILVIAPSVPGTTGPVSVMVQNSSGEAVTNNNIFSYFSNQFRAENQPFSGTSGISTTGDFNADGHLDLAVVIPGDVYPSNPDADISPKLMIYLGNGDGTLQSPLPSLSLPCEPVELLSGYPPASDCKMPAILMAKNMDGENGDDLLILNRRADMIGDEYIDYQTNNGKIIWVLYSKPDGSFSMDADSDKPDVQKITNGRRINNFDVADIDHDGLLDVIIATDQQVAGYNLSGSIYTFMGIPNHQFSLDQVFFIPESYYVTVQAADFNHDGHVDLVYYDNIYRVVSGEVSNTSMLSVVFGDELGRFHWDQAQTLNIPACVQKSITVADLNHDGKLDVLFKTIETLSSENYLHPSLLFLPGKGDGTFDVSTTFTFDTGYSSFLVSDVNGDGTQDLVLIHESTDTFFSVYLGKGEGTFQPKKSFSLPPIMTGNGPQPVSVGNQITLGDFNKDGLPDFILSGHVYWYPSGTVDSLHFLKNTSR